MRPGMRSFRANSAPDPTFIGDPALELRGHGGAARHRYKMARGTTNTRGMRGMDRHQ
jgi:hypothetical protein